MLPSCVSFQVRAKSLVNEFVRTVDRTEIFLTLVPGYFLWSCALPFPPSLPSSLSQSVTCVLPAVEETPLPFLPPLPFPPLPLSLPPPFASSPHTGTRSTRTTNLLHCLDSGLPVCKQALGCNAPLRLRLSLCCFVADSACTQRKQIFLKIALKLCVLFCVATRIGEECDRIRGATSAISKLRGEK